MDSMCNDAIRTTFGSFGATLGSFADTSYKYLGWGLFLISGPNSTERAEILAKIKHQLQFNLDQTLIITEMTQFSNGQLLVNFDSVTAPANPSINLSADPPASPSVDLPDCPSANPPAKNEKRIFRYHAYDSSGRKPEQGTIIVIATDVKAADEALATAGKKSAFSANSIGWCCELNGIALQETSDYVIALLPPSY